MYRELMTVLKAFYTAAKAIQEHLKRADTERQQLALLTAQHCFAGLAETGRQLLELAGPKPLEKLANLSGDGLRDFSTVAQKLITHQRLRLDKLHGLVQDQQVIDLFDMSLRREIAEAIGDKEEGLYSIGAGLLFYCVFFRPSPESSAPQDLEQTAEIICATYPEIERGVISVPDAVEALDALTAMAQRYGEVLRLIVPVDRFMPLSKEAAKLAMVDG